MTDMVRLLSLGIRCVGILSLVILTLNASATRVPADYPTMPLYFSGAACRASGAVDESEGPPIWMDLFVNGELVAHWDWFQDVPEMPEGLQVMFDSSHFPNGTTVTVEFDAYFLYGGASHASGTSVVGNRAVLFGRHDFEVTGHPDQFGFPAVLSSLSSSNYVSIWQITTLGWADYDYLASLESNPNVLYIHTHGDAGVQMPSPPQPAPVGTWLLSDYDELPSPPQYPVDPFYINSGECLAARQAAIGTGGLPPYNPSGKPPINIGFNDGCLTGLGNGFAEAYLWPYQNAYGMWTECQSQLGWSVLKYSLATRPCMEEFWTNMQIGYTADEARVEAENRYYQWVMEHGIEEKLPGQRFLIHCYGDWYARLHGVYSGTDADSPMANWYGEPILL